MNAEKTLRQRIIATQKQSSLIKFSDTTLRDGEQMPGASLNPEAKLIIAKALADLGIDSLDAGFPASSADEIEAIKRIAQEVKGPVILGLCRTKKSDIDCAYEALQAAPPQRRGASLFLATSPVHRQYKLDKTKNEIIDTITSSIDYAAQYFELVSFAAEDAPRTELDFLCQVYENAIQAGAVTIAFPDTIGILTPEKVSDLINYLQDHVPSFEKALLAVHFHNDYGLATANCLSAITAGADIVQCTVNGIGERAGNASFEEVVMALEMNKQQYGKRTNIDTSQLTSVSRLVEKHTGIITHPMKPVTGSNVFLTEAGIHQDGLLKNPATYLPFMPDTVGAPGIELVLGKHSGKAAFAEKLKTLGFDLSPDQIALIIKKTHGLPKEAWHEPEKTLCHAVAQVVKAQCQ